MEKQKVLVEVDGLTSDAVPVSTHPQPVVPEVPYTFEPIPTGPLVTPQRTEKSSAEPLSLPLHEDASAKNAEKVKKRQSFLTRALWTLIMISGFIGM